MTTELRTAVVKSMTREQAQAVLLQIVPLMTRGYDSGGDYISDYQFDAWLAESMGQS